MASHLQIDANRSNACHSTGPRTASGIEASRYNATKHGLSGKQVITKDEDPAAYDELRRQLAVEHAPATEQEAMLVEEIAQNWWRLQRARRVEAAVIRKFGELECIIDPDARRAFLTVTRYLNTIQRTWNRACKDLQALQKLRHEQEQERAASAAMRSFAASRPHTSTPTPLPAEIGFVSVPAHAPVQPQPGSTL